MNEKIVSLLGISRKAGYLVLGRGAVKEQAQNGNVKLILMMCDLSSRSEREVKEMAEEYRVPIFKVDVSMEELRFILGRVCGVVGISDGNMAKKINEILIMNVKEECSL